MWPFPTGCSYLPSLLPVSLNISLRAVKLDQGLHSERLKLM